MRHKKHVGGPGYFVLLITIMTVVYFAIPTGSISQISFGKNNPVKAKQIVSNTPTAAAQVTDNSQKNAQVQQTQTVPSGNTVKVPVLMYHHVADLTSEQRAADPLGSDLTVSVPDFENQVKYFKGLGYRTISIDQLYQGLINKESLPTKPIVFTFDDGYKDVFENAIPILEKYGYTGSFAVATQLLGRPGYAVWDDVLTAEEEGMEILSHTENHLDLTSTTYSQDDLHREIFGSKDELESKLGHKVDYFVYPYGHFNYFVSLMVQGAGYKMAFTTNYGMYIAEGTLFTEPRVRVHGENGLDKLKVLFGTQHTWSDQTNP